MAEQQPKTAAERLANLADSLTMSLNKFVTKQLEATSTMSTSCISFVDETLHLIKRSRDDYEMRLKHEAEVEQLATSASEEEQKLNAQIAHARAQLDALKGRYETLQKEYQKAMDNFENEKRLAFESLPSSQRGQIKEDLEWRVKNYESMLRMRIEQKDEHRIAVIFWGLNPADEAQQYSFELITNDNGELSLENSSIEVANLDLFLADAQITGNIPLLIRRIRRSFLQMAECEGTNFSE